MTFRCALLLLQVEKAIVWQVGNYPCLKFDSWWEGPVYENGKLKKWHYAWMPDRVFPIDLNGFAVNSSQIGEGRPINPRKGPERFEAASVGSCCIVKHDLAEP